MIYTYLVGYVANKNGFTVGDCVATTNEPINSGEKIVTLRKDLIKNCKLEDCSIFNLQLLNIDTEEKVETQEPKFGEWIPFKKQFPPMAAWIYISCAGDKPFIGAMMENFNDSLFAFEVVNFYSNRTNILKISIDDANCIAWMPLPEPYKGGVDNG